MKLYTFVGILSRFGYCSNVVQTEENVRCKNCNVVIGKIVENSSQGLFVELLNIRLVEFFPYKMEYSTSSSKECKFSSRFEEKHNHLKRRSENENEGPEEKYPKLGRDEPICLMRIIVPPSELIESHDLLESLTIPDFDLDDTFSDISDFDLSPDIGFEDVIPFLHDVSPMINLNSTVADMSILAQSPTFSEDDVYSNMGSELTVPFDYELEFIPVTPPGKIF